MKVCFPVAEDQGINSKVFNHFNSSPYFLIIDTDAEEIKILPNCDPKNEMYGCNAAVALEGQSLNAIVVGGISDALLQFLNMQGYQVYETNTDNIQKNLELLKKDELAELYPFYSQYEGQCGDEDGSEGDCNHDHDHHHHEHDLESDAKQEQCVLHGGSGCGSHVKGECEGH